MILDSKYPGTCAVCGNRYDVGDKIEWHKGAPTRHARCGGQLLPANCTAIKGVHWKPGNRGMCGLSLGPPMMHPVHSIAYHACADGHESFKCPHCGVVRRAVAKRPANQEETWFSNYHCGGCGKGLFSDEGFDPKWGDLT